MLRRLTYLWICVNFAVLCSGLTRCKNPNGKNGLCIPLNSCSTLKSVQSKNSPESNRFLQASQCVNEVGDGNNVCCSKDTGFLGTATQKPVQSVDLTPVVTRTSSDNSYLLPDLKHCGRVPLGEKIYGGSETKIDDFTWMALIEYTYDNGTLDYKCAGSLINERYVLTAAHCIKRSGSKTKITAVRLGENNLATNPDCDRNGICAPPPIDVKIETIIVHEEYKNRAFSNDIALIRLDRNIKPTPFIQPICLPGTGNLKQSPVGTNLIVAGWGYTEYGHSTNGKLQVDVPVFDQDECKKIYRAKNFIVTDNQLCAGGILNKDSCQGDSGGPLMRSKNDKLFLEGIVSLGIGCGIAPGVYTRVEKYEDWIKSKIAP